MSGKEKVDIKRSDQFEEVDAELSRAIAELDFSIDRVSAIFDGTADENTPVEVEESDNTLEEETKSQTPVESEPAPKNIEADIPDTPEKSE